MYLKLAYVKLLYGFARLFLTGCHLREASVFSSSFEVFELTICMSENAVGWGGTLKTFSNKAEDSAFYLLIHCSNNNVKPDKMASYSERTTFSFYRNRSHLF